MLREERILTILDAIGCGALILDAKGTVLQTNGRASRYFGQEMRLKRTGSGISNYGMQVALRKALRASTEVMPQLGDFIVVPRPPKRPLVLRTIRLPDDQEGGQELIAALIVLDMEDCPEPADELLREVFLLTPAEIRMSQRLARGDSLNEIAEDSSLSIATVRVHFRSVFAKTGTARQGELVALLAHLTRLNPEKPPA